LSDGIEQECGCGSAGEFGIPDGSCDCDGTEPSQCGLNTILGCEDVDEDGI
jgi:hypothetical protein